jgi:hypothetical protein
MEPNLQERNMEKTSRGIGRACIALVAAAATVAAFPVTAEAKKPPKGPKPPVEAHFRATLSGSQVTTWEYHHAKNQDDPCSASSHGYGDQTIKFDAGGHFDVRVVKPPKGNPNLLLTHGRPAVIPPSLAVAVKAERHGEYHVNYGEIDRNNCKGENGGGGDYTPPPTDCGAREGIFRAKLFYDTDRDQNRVFVPMSGKKGPDANRLKLGSWLYEFKNPKGGRPSSLDSTYTNCPWLLQDSQVEREGTIFTSQASLPEKRLFDKKRKKFVVSGHVIAKRGGGDSTGQTIIAWNLRLTRVK